MREELDKQARGLVHNILPLVQISPLESSSSSKCEEGRRFQARISVTFQFANNIQKLVRLMLEWLKKNVFSRRSKVVTRLGVTTKKPMEILDLSDEKDDERICTTQQLITKTLTI